MKYTKSIKLFSEAVKHIPGGVNSPVRAFKSVSLDPLYISKAKGAYMYDEDGNKFIDYVGSWGPMILGHARKEVIGRINAMAKNGTSFGACCAEEVKLAKLIKKFVPSLELVRMVNSGTEATMSAIRLARAYTGRNKIIKFEGCYHGHADSFLIKAGSGAATFGIPDSPGVTKAVATDTLTAAYNDIKSVKKLFRENKNKIAAVMIEPIAGNMGCVRADKRFLRELKDLCRNEKSLLIFDEVMTGFRVAKGGAQEIYGIKPDLSTFGKVIGGGLPVGAYGGSKKIMSMISPSGPVYQAGTLSGNPLAMAAGFETLNIIDKDKSFYSKLEKSSAYLEEGIRGAVKSLGLNYTLNRAGSMFTLFFSESPVTDYAAAKKSNTVKFAKYFREMLFNGIYLAPSQFEACFISISHGKKELDNTIKAVYKALNMTK
ncbi:MAG: glutamate-1-semialdehyde 2,1-aminomutase [Bacteroidetes bacterium]|nr:glutamate-1-semialdehyde 2,1-aminomutase [Bacteroidota bacterium]